MTMTPERLAELDAVMAKARAFPFGTVEWEVAFTVARLAAYNAIPDLRAHIDEQAATIAEWRKALNMIARGTTFRSKGGAIIDVPLRDKDARNAVIAALKATGDA